MQVAGTSPRIGHPTLACRYMGSASIAAPLVYWSTVTDGDASHFLMLVLLAPIAGIALFGNSVFCLARYRSWKSARWSLLFVVLSVIGVLEAGYFLPRFRM